MKSLILGIERTDSSEEELDESAVGEEGEEEKGKNQRNLIMKEDML